MKEKDDNYVKVLFQYFSPVLNQDLNETMWAVKVNEGKGIFRLDNIPFYGPLIAPNDEFFAEFDDNEGMLTYRYTTKHSGYSVVLIAIMNESYDKETLRDEFRALECASEGMRKSFLSMEIPMNVDYSTIKKKLDLYMESGYLEYSEPCLSEKHRADLERISPQDYRNRMNMIEKLKRIFKK